MNITICIKGTTLIEVLIALVIISSLLISTLHLQNKALQIHNQQHALVEKQLQQRNDYETHYHQ